MTSESADRRDEVASSLLSKLRGSLAWGKARLGRDLRELLSGRTWDEETREDVETRLLQADVGVDATTWLLGRLDGESGSGAAGPNDALEIMRNCIVELLKQVEGPLAVDAGANPFVILVVGVNGTGKTTTIGKLARRLTAEGLSVMLAAGDTFRAAAVEQLLRWGERAGASVVAQEHGADPASVVFDALSSARARGIDVLIADTAGRLHSSRGLMDELGKIKRVMSKVDAAIPHEILLVLDASQGQNALVQATEFNAALGLTGLVITKLDGTARGGILLAIARQLGIPVRFVGVGEGADDLQPFDAMEFTEALLGVDTE